MEKTVEQIVEIEQEFEPKIVAFLCKWCSSAGSDLAGVSRLQYPPNVIPVTVMCSGCISPLYVLSAFNKGADAVLVSGCHPGDCHYMKGNYYARRRINLLKNLMEYIGLEPQRFQMAWVSASEGAKYAQMITEIVEELKPLGPQSKLTMPTPGGPI